jgi:hypothetical protein
VHAPEGLTFAVPFIGDRPIQGGRRSKVLKANDLRVMNNRQRRATSHAR